MGLLAHRPAPPTPPLPHRGIASPKGSERCGRSAKVTQKNEQSARLRAPHPHPGLSSYAARWDPGPSLPTHAGRALAGVEKVSGRGRGGRRRRPSQTRMAAAGREAQKGSALRQVPGGIPRPQPLPAAGLPGHFGFSPGTFRCSRSARTPGGQSPTAQGPSVPGGRRLRPRPGRPRTALTRRRLGVTTQLAARAVEQDAARPGAGPSRRVPAPGRRGSARSLAPQ